jgi:hypothetical protein
MAEQQNLLDLIRSKERGSESSVPLIDVEKPKPKVEQGSVLDIIRSKETQSVNPNPVIQDQPTQKRVIEPLVVPKEATEDQALALQLAPAEAREEVLENIQPTVEDQTDEMLSTTRVEESEELFDTIYEMANDIENMSDQEFINQYGISKEEGKREDDKFMAEMGTNTAEQMRKDFNSGYQAYGALDIWIANKVDGDADNMRTLLNVGRGLSYITSGTTDGIEEGLKLLKEAPYIGEWTYNQLNNFMSGRLADAKDEGTFQSGPVLS